VAMMFDQVSTSGAHVKGGKLRALGVTTKTRSPVLPEVPTAAEAGLPDFVFLNWFAYLAPRGTPEAVVDRYAGLVSRALAIPDVAGRIRATGDLPGAGTRQDLAAAIAREHRVFGEVVRAQRIRAE